eukprot:2713264-Pyramimonas_sp.AAC.1
MLHTQWGYKLFMGPLNKVPPVVGRGPAIQQGASAVTSQDAPVRWRLYSEFAWRGVRAVLIEKIV